MGPILICHLRFAVFCVSKETSSRRIRTVDSWKLVTKKVTTSYDFEIVIKMIAPNLINIASFTPAE